MPDTYRTNPAPSDLSPRSLPLSLLLLRLGVTIVMAFWTVDKLLNPDHAEKVFKGFYGIDAIGENGLALIAIAQGLIVLAFALGAFKTVSYGAVLVMHAISTLASWKQYLDPFENLLFLAAWPMLAACVALFLMRDHDRLLAFGQGKSARDNAVLQTADDDRRGVASQPQGTSE